jgi:hypothetical protein
MRIKFLSGFLFVAVIFSCTAQNTTEMYPENDSKLFDKVCSKLEKGGSYFNYQNNKYIFRAIEDTYSKLPAAIKAIVPDEQQQILPLMIYSCLKPIALNLGVNEMLAGGASSKLICEKTPEHPALFRTRQFVYYGDKQPQGLIWEFASGKNHEFAMLNTLPTETLFACCNESMPGNLWSKIKKILTQTPFPPVQSAGALAEQHFFNKFQVKLTDVLDSLSGRCSSLIINGQGKDGKPALYAMLKIPDKKGLGFKVISEMLKSRTDIKTESSEIRFKSETPIDWLKPTIRKQGEYIYILSNPKVMEILAETNARKSFLTQTAEFKYLNQGMPSKGIAFFYFSSRAFKAFVDTVKAYAPAPTAKDIDWLKLTALIPPSDFFVIVSKEKDGILATMNSPLDIPQLITYSSVMPSLVQLATLLPALNKTRPKVRQATSLKQLKQIGLALKVYAMNHKDKYPAGNNIEGFNELIKANDLDDMSIFICPNAKHVKAAGKKLKEENCSYIYIGGFTEGDGVNIPLAFDKFGNNEKIINILYQDGRVDAVPANFKNCTDLFDYLIKINKYDEKTIKKLKAKSAELDKQMGLK